MGTPLKEATSHRLPDFEIFLDTLLKSLASEVAMRFGEINSIEGNLHDQ